MPAIERMGKVEKLILEKLAKHCLHFSLIDPDPKKIKLGLKVSDCGRMAKKKNWAKTKWHNKEMRKVLSSRARMSGDGMRIIDPGWWRC